MLRLSLKDIYGSTDFGSFIQEWFVYGVFISVLLVLGWFVDLVPRETAANLPLRAETAWLCEETWPSKMVPCERFNEVQVV